MRVVNIRTVRAEGESIPNLFYVGRPSRWGNPFMIGTDGTREEVVKLYRSWIQDQPGLMADLHTLRGKVLGCYCAPLLCHANVLVELIEAEKVEVF